MCKQYYSILMLLQASTQLLPTDLLNTPFLNFVAIRRRALPPSLAYTREGHTGK
jgi:hypothetical protein